MEAAIRYQEEKVEKYAHEVELQFPGETYHPVTMEAYGAWGPKLKHLFHSMIDDAGLEPAAKSSVTSYWRMRLSNAMFSSQAEAALAHMARINCDRSYQPTAHSRHARKMSYQQALAAGIKDF